MFKASWGECFAVGSVLEVPSMPGHTIEAGERSGERALRSTAEIQQHINSQHSAQKAKGSEGSAATTGHSRKVKSWAADSQEVSQMLPMASLSSAREIDVLPAFL